jgi:hypothetical protein
VSPRSLLADICIRYNLSNVKTISPVVLSFLLSAAIGAAAQDAFRVSVPDLKGKEAKAVLLFDDTDKTINVRPAKLVPVNIPYGNIEKCAYEYTDERTVALAEAKVHWLEIDYREGDAHKVLMLRMTSRNHIRILDALKSHTGIDAEILGNADKRRGGIWSKF